MDSLLDLIVIRLQKYAYPIMHGKIRDDVISMLERLLNVNSSDISKMNPVLKQLLIENIVKRYKIAMMPENEPVGTLAAQTISENMTLSSLSSHHFAGVKKGATGFARSEELTDLTDTGLCKIITTPIEFGNGVRIPRDKVALNQLANSVISINMKDLVAGYEIIKEEPYPGWYKLLLLLMAKSDTFLQLTRTRIYLDKDLMYKYRISLPVIANILNTRIESLGLVLYPPASLVDPSKPLYIDIHISQDDTDSKKYKRLGELFAVLVGGIASVQTAYPLFINMLDRLEIEPKESNIYEVTSAAPTYVPDFAWEYMIRSMIPDAEIVPGFGGRRFLSDETLDELKRMMLQCPMKYGDVVLTSEERSGKWYVTFDESKVLEFPYLEYADLTPHVFNTQQEMKAFLLDMMVERHFFWYMECICNKLFDLFALPEIDSTRSFTTSPLDCNNTFGYLVMRLMLYNELRENIKVNDLWLKTMLNYMTLYSEPAAIRRLGVRHDKSAWLKYTTFEEVLKYVTYAAFMGEEDDMESVSSQVLTGQMIDVGRGGRNLLKVNKFVTLKNQSDEENLRSQLRKASEGRRTSSTATGLGGPATRSTAVPTTKSNTKRPTASAPGTRTKGSVASTPTGNVASTASSAAGPSTRRFVEIE